WCRARRRENGREDTIEKCPADAFLARQVARGLHRAAGCHFEDPKKIEGNERDESRHQNDENRILELHSPTRGVTRLLDSDNEQSQNEKRSKDAESVNRPENAHAS